jgi:hypothetical protein
LAGCSQSGPRVRANVPPLIAEFKRFGLRIITIFQYNKPSSPYRMSDNGEAEVSGSAGNLTVLPKEVVAEIGSVKLFNKWSYEDVEIRDISLT